jgi:hypothetical protein
MAGIDVHKKRLAVVVADVEVEDEYQFERRWYGSNPEQLRVLSEWLIEQQVEEVVMESTAILEACLGSAGAILEGDVSESGRCRPDVGDTTSGTSLVQSRAARAQDRFSRRRTFGEAARITGASVELRARCRTTPVANTNPHKVSPDA